ncbi:MAG: hypothetical protein ABW117_14780 [Candidatus Sedimenticola sp. 1PA]
MQPVKCSKQGGVALILSLWLIVLLTIIGGSHSRNVRLDTRLTSSHLAKTQARMLAEAGLNRAIMELFVVEPGQRWLFDGTEYTLKLDTAVTDIRIQNASGLINLNSSSPELLSALFSAAGLKELEAAELVAAIFDWRDQDDLTRINGAEDLEYKLEYQQYGTPDREFTSVEELRYVMGMTEELYKRIRPFLTVYSDIDGVNTDYLSVELQELLSGSPVSGASLFTSDELDSGDVSTVVGGGDLDGRLSDAYHITVRADFDGRAKAFLSVVVDVKRQQGQLYVFRLWDEYSREIEVKDV